ncbi:hypothetical protein FACS18949_09810 [Clostridia bacterium]|nr:hypothetical protein FACS18949_09810 [Clostridia bacterium]
MSGITIGTANNYSAYKTKYADPADSSRMDVDIAGAFLPNGKVTIVGSTRGMRCSVMRYSIYMYRLTRFSCYFPPQYEEVYRKRSP